MNNLDIIKQLNGTVNTAIKRYFISTPIIEYPANIAPDAEPNPPHITANNSDLVNLLIYGFINSGASVPLKNALPTVEKVSTLPVPIYLATAVPIILTKKGITFKKYNTDIKADVNTIKDNTLTANIIGPDVKSPNTNVTPFIPICIILFTPIAKASNIFCPIGTFITKNIKTNCPNKPAITVLHLIAFLSSDIMYDNPIITVKVIIPNNIFIIFILKCAS